MKSKIIWIGVVVIFIGLVIVGINRKSNDEIIKVGVIASLSGEYGTYGESFVNAVVMNAEKDSKIKLFVEDSKFDPKVGLTAYQKLTSIDHIDILVNFDSLTLEAITPLAIRANLPVIQIFETHDHMDDSIFQMLPFSYPLFTRLGEISSKKYKNIAIVYSSISDAFSIDTEYFKKGIASTTQVSEIKIAKSAYIRSEVTKMLSGNYDAFTLLLPVSDGIRFLKEYRDQKVDKNISLICDANIEMTISEYVKALGPEIFEGCLSTNLPDTMTSTFKKDYRARFNSDPTVAADWGYDAITIIKGLENISKDNWLSKIARTSIEGASGHVEFDNTGTRVSISESRIFKDGKFVKLEE